MSPAMRPTLHSQRNWNVLRWQCLGKIPGPRAGRWLWERCKLFHKVTVNVHNDHITIALSFTIVNICCCTGIWLCYTGLVAICCPWWKSLKAQEALYYWIPYCWAKLNSLCFLSTWLEEKWAQAHGPCAFCLPCQFWYGIEVSALCLARAALGITLHGLSWNRHGPVLSPVPRSHGWEAEVLLRLQEHSCSSHSHAPELGLKSFIEQVWRFPTWARMGSDLYLTG